MTTENRDIRWEQRFLNFRKTLSQLKKFINKGGLSELEEQGLIQSFEYTYELGWNVLKDFMEYKGQTEMYGSRDAISKAFQLGLIENGEGWMDMYKSRTKTSHTYNEKTAEEVVKAILSGYLDLFKALENKLENLRTTSQSPFIDKE